MNEEKMKQGQALLSQKVNEAYDALTEAQQIADEHGLSFSFSPEYGMGGYYDGEDAEWNPSSQSC